MRVTSQTSSDGVTEQLFTLDEIPGVLWTPSGDVPPHGRSGRALPRGLILAGHGGGQHKKAPGLVARARRFALERGYAVAAVDAPGHGDRPRTEELDQLIAELRSRMQTGNDSAAVLAELHTVLAAQSVPEWRAVLDAVQKLDTVGMSPVGYWGMSLGCGLGVPFVAAEPRVRAAVLGLSGDQTSGRLAAQVRVPVQFVVQWDDEMVPRASSLALFDLFGSADKTLHANPGKHGEVPRFEVDSAMQFFDRHLS